MDKFKASAGNHPSYALPYRFHNTTAGINKMDVEYNFETAIVQSEKKFPYFCSHYKVLWPSG